MDLGNVLNKQIEKTIEEHWPQIQKIFQEKVGPAALAAAENDKAVEAIFSLVYQGLPFPVKLVVKKDAFVNFCLANRDRFI
ncbi:MAG: hypothetical protein FWC36_10945 [Spirochaetes bacterium]|nr:hypothetical protein [Spirochaetota bacterium]